MTDTLSKDDIAGILTTYVREAVAAYPQLKGVFVIADVSTGIIAEDIEYGRTGFADDLALKGYLKGYCIPEAIRQNSTMSFYAAQKVNIICTHMPLAFTGSAREDLINALDHELGHLLVPGAMWASNSISDNNYAETAADIFQCLQDYKRHGTQSNIAQVLAGYRAQAMALYQSAPTHFTSFALEELHRIKGRLDIAQMTHDQMLQLARDMSASYSLNRVLLDNMSMSFSYVIGELGENRTHEDRLKALADVLCKEKLQQHLFHSGLLALAPDMHAPQSRLKDPYWKETRKILREKEMRMEAEGILFGMPLKPASKKPSQVTSRARKSL